MKWSKEVLENINFENITNREEKEKIAIDNYNELMKYLTN